MTTLDLMGNVTGTSIVGDVCEIRREAEKRNGVSIVSDDIVYGGISTAVHEVGHALGLNHDDKGNNCPDGYAMDPGSKMTTNSMFFSHCSMRQLSSLLSEGKLNCMYVEWPRNKGLVHLMPGKLMSLDRQCQKLGHKRACTTYMENVCVNLRCLIKKYLDWDWEVCKTYHDRGAAPGTPCGPNDGIKRFCLFNQCFAFKA